MSFKATFLVEERAINILYCEYTFSRQVNKNLCPVSFPQSEPVYVQLESDKENLFESWCLASSQKKNCRLIFYKRDNMSVMKELVLSDVYCVSFREKYSSSGVHPFFVEVKLSAGEMKYGLSVYRNPWFELTGQSSENENTYSEGSFQTQKLAVAPTKSIDEIKTVTPTVMDPIDIGKSPLDPEMPFETEVLQEVLVVPEEPGFVKKFLIRAMPYVDKHLGPYVNSAINAIAVKIANNIPVTLATYISDRYTGNQKAVDPSWDGKILSCDNCNGSGQCGIVPTAKCPTESVASPAGKKPVNKDGKTCSSTSLKKIVYMNGIITDPKTNCQTSKLISKALCAEVSSMYNRTEGMGGDLSECLRSIRKAHKVPPSDAMVKMMQNHFGNPPKEPFGELNLMAHSQGGLITQQSLIRFKEDLKSKISEEEIEEVMSNIKVKSFGTAVHGWPKGPEYEQFTNYYDPVPQVISSAQLKYYDKTFTPDSQPVETIKSHMIVDAKVNPIGPHSMDDVYLKKLMETTGKNIEGKCSSCPNA